MPMPPSERIIHARANAHTSWANTHDRLARTAPARAAADARFLTEADGDPVRAESLRKAFYARLSLISARSRRQAREATAAAEAAEAELTVLGGADDAA